MRRRSIPVLLAGALAATVLSPATAAVAQEGTPVMGTSFLDEGELVSWFNAERPSHLAFRAGDTGDGPVSVRRLVRLYLQEGAREGVAADMAFVQALHETAWFNFPDYGCVRPHHNNFAGMGAVDDCGDRPEVVLEFPSTRVGVRAQLQHLRAYVDPGTNLNGTNLGSPLATDVRGEYPPRWRYVRRTRNEPRSWEEFGGGVWASDPNYAAKIMDYYHRALLHNGYPTHAATSAPWYVRTHLSGGDATHEAYLGRTRDDRFLACDWDGDGTDTPGVFRDGTWILSDAPNGGGALTIFAYGRGRDVPICGDWDGDGTDTVGIIRGGTWHLRNALRGGPSDRSFTYGRVDRGDTPVVGDFNGSGSDGPGIVRGGVWHLKNALSGGPSLVSFTYGRVDRGDVPVTGDFNGDGHDSPGIVRGNQWHLRHSRSGGAADRSFAYGRITGGDVPVMADWDGNGRAGPAVVR